MRFWNLFALLLAVFVAKSSAQNVGEIQLIAPQWVASDAATPTLIRIVVPGEQAESLMPGQLTVALSTQSGEMIVAKPVPGTVNEFSIVGVSTGIYSVMVKGPEISALYAMHLVQSDNGGVPPALAVTIPAANLSVKTIRDAVIRYLPPTIQPIATFDVEAGLRAIAAVPGAGVNRIMQVDGGMSGQILQAGLRDGEVVGSPLTNVLIYQRDQLVRKEVTDARGEFQVPTLPAGYYSVIAIGPQGMGITSFELVDELMAAKSTPSSNRLVARQPPTAPSSFQLQLAPVSLESPVVDQLTQPSDGPQPAAPPIAGAGGGIPAGGGPGGLGGGGGGGGLGGGGLGGILGLAAAGAGVAALSSDDDDTFVPPPEISPNSPIAGNQ